MENDYKKQILYVDNEDLNVNNWIPDIFDPCYNIKSNSWFDIEITKNLHSYKNNYNYSFNSDLAKIVSINNAHYVNYKYETVKTPFLPPPRFVRGKKREPEFIYAEKVRIYPTPEQAIIFHKWFDLFTKMYNITLNYISSKIYVNGRVNMKIAKKIVKFGPIRTFLVTKREQLRATQPPKERMPTHILDEAINHAVKNCKGSMTSKQNGHIKKFRIREWKYNRNRKILIIESNFIRNSTIYPDVFPKLNSSERFDKVNKTCTLQYNKIT